MYILKTVLSNLLLVKMINVSKISVFFSGKNSHFLFSKLRQKDGRNILVPPAI